MTCRAEHFFLPIQFIKGIRLEHDTLRVGTVPEAQEMQDLVCTFFCYPVNEIIIISRPVVIFIAEPGRRNNCCTDGFPCKPEHKTVAVLKKVLPDNKEKGFFNIIESLEGMNTIQQYLGIDLLTPVHIPHYPHGII